MTIWIPIAKFFRIKSPQNRTERCCSRPRIRPVQVFINRLPPSPFHQISQSSCSSRKGGIRPSARLDVKPAFAFARANGFIGNKKVSYHPIFIRLFFNETTVNYSFLTACLFLSLAQIVRDPFSIRCGAIGYSHFRGTAYLQFKRQSLVTPLDCCFIRICIIYLFAPSGWAWSRFSCHVWAATFWHFLSLGKQWFFIIFHPE